MFIYSLWYGCHKCGINGSEKYSVTSCQTPTAYMRPKLSRPTIYKTSMVVVLVCWEETGVHMVLPNRLFG